MNQIVWLAGLLEGEGNFRHQGKSAAIIQLGMTDRDIVERASQIMGNATVRVYQTQASEA